MSYEIDKAFSYFPFVFDNNLISIIAKALKKFKLFS